MLICGPVFFSLGFLTQGAQAELALLPPGGSAQVQWTPSFLPDMLAQSEVCTGCEIRSSCLSYTLILSPTQELVFRLPPSARAPWWSRPSRPVPSTT